MRQPPHACAELALARSRSLTTPYILHQRVHRVQRHGYQASKAQKAQGTGFGCSPGLLLWGRGGPRLLSALGAAALCSIVVVPEDRPQLPHGRAV